MVKEPSSSGRACPSGEAGSSGSSGGSSSSGTGGRGWRRTAAFTREGSGGDGAAGAMTGQMVTQRAAKRPGRYFKFMSGPPFHN